MSGDEFCFIAHEGAIWARWSCGKPDLMLGPEEQILVAMKKMIRNEGQSVAGLKSRGNKSLNEIPTSSELSRSSESHPAPSSPPLGSKVMMERAEPRHEIIITGRIFTSAGSRDVKILDLSEAGCQFRDIRAHLERDGRLSIKLGPIGPITAVVRWRHTYDVGVRFDTFLHPSVLQHIRDHFDTR